MWQTIKLYWGYFRNTLGTLILLLPFFMLRPCRLRRNFRCARFLLGSAQ